MGRAEGLHRAHRPDAGEGAPISSPQTLAKARRPNKIFADYLRNSETASAIAAYAPRARPGAGVSVPLAWDELDPKDDLRARFNVLNVPKRLARLKDPWPAIGGHARPSPRR
jgi:bifunctional non-homologous end joining protein LigD